jgi:hypothetical protein
MLERLVGDKRSSLFDPFITYGEKNAFCILLLSFVKNLKYEKSNVFLPWPISGLPN